MSTREVLQEATPGILFVDEFHDLHQRGYSGDEDPYGNAMISALLKYMEDHRDELIVIGAGYTGQVEDVLRQNRGLRGRFALRIPCVTGLGETVRFRVHHYRARLGHRYRDHDHLIDSGQRRYWPG
ncbi:AAA family ATPase, partial [Tsukamurella soli]|uniref:AAA family ATPase n=1 Tax=Tsukamurella soli TaxID=644556 RepID=UPI0031E81331